MKTIINGKRYNTDTAEHVCNLPCRLSPSDFGHHDTSLYCTTSGMYFLAGWGGPASMWSQSTGQNSWTGGSGIRPVSFREALRHMEDACALDEIERRFPVEDA